jgi:amidase
VGFRPSAGLVPARPSTTAWCTLAVEGPMARTVEDVALMLSAIAGYDASSPLAWPIEGASFRRPLDRDVRGLRVAWGNDLGGLPMDPRVREVLERCGRPALESMGCVVEDAEPDFTGAEESFRTQRAWYYAAWLAEEYAVHRGEMNPDIAWNVECGLSLTGADLARAEQQRSALYDRMCEFFTAFDVLALPVSQVPPFAVDLPWVTEIAGVPQHTYLDWMRSAYYISATGLPAISVPCGFTPDGLPVGIQLVGRPAGDFELLQFAHAFESVTHTGRTLPVP